MTMKRLASSLVLVLVLLSSTQALAKFGLGVSVGGYTGDRLYSAASNTPRIWLNPTGEVSGFGDELLVDLESWAQIGLSGWTDFTERFGLRVDLAFTDVDVDGKVRASSGAVENVQWDQWFIIDFIAQATWRLGRSTDSYPYLSLGPSLSIASSEGSTLDQTMPGMAYGAGWRISAEEGAYLDIAVRGQLQWTDFSDEEARLAADEFKGENPINGLSLAVSFGYVF
jgi:hypothetical protein